ncbi:MAG: hypothetical protein K9M54_03485 [Kiritimatiellales bacterium]|nr:hypothetical protein [Kiritimatiellales bacterium]
MYLQKVESGEFVPASLYDEITDEHLAMWSASWIPAMKVHCNNCPLLDSPEDSHWDWKRKAEGWRELLGYRSFSLVCDNELQGLMLVNDITSARLLEQFGKPIVYVQFLSTAPWNRLEIASSPKYRGVGRIMVLASIECSRESGFKGRIGLHSLPRAEVFYEQKCGFTRLGNDSRHQNLCYFEMTEKQADDFCHK